MSGDRLARDREDLVRSINHGFRIGGLLGVERGEEIVATWDVLVEIAKAARAVNEHAKRDLPEWYADDGDYTVEDFDYFIQLDRALARLGSGAAEEQA